MTQLKKAVGAGTYNADRTEVRLVQSLVNRHRPSPLMPISEDGLVGPKTIEAIREFQQRVVGMPFGSGVVEPGSATWNALSGNTPLGPVVGPLPGAVPSPIGKNFQQRLDDFLADAKSRYGITIPKGVEFRKAEDAQRWHIAHMIAYNSFASLKPANFETVNGRRLISWSHLSSATLVWQHVSSNDFLRTATGGMPVKQGTVWSPTAAPDKDKTIARAKEILKSAGVATPKDRPSDPNSAMVAPGYTGCAEPCRCGGTRSNHIAGAAADLGRTELTQLESKLQAAGAGTLDNYLKSFGLHRPMSSEPWHVEATTP